MTYQPKTTAEYRDKINQLSLRQHDVTKIARAVLDDLASCEAALAEEQLETERLKEAMPDLTKRLCRDCGNIAYHCIRTTPWVLCRKCGSQDTRITLEEFQPPERSVIAASGFTTAG